MEVHPIAITKSTNVWDLGSMEEKKIHNLSLLFTVVLSCGRIRSLKSANFVKWLGCIASKIHVFAYLNKGTFGISKA